MEITFRLETAVNTREKNILVHQSISSEKLLQHAKTEFDRADIIVEQYTKEDDAWHKLGPNVKITHGDTFKVKIIAEKVCNNFTTSGSKI